jgi:hypothetical protein
MAGKILSEVVMAITDIQTSNLCPEVPALCLCYAVLD